jgi:serine/threonine protein kinase
LGGGNYSEVSLACLKTANEGHILVAIKAPKKTSLDMEESEHEVRTRKSERNAIRNELKILMTIGEHPNVIKLCGAVTTNKSNFCVLTEYCENGSLDRFLKLKFKNGLFIDQVFVGNGNIYYQQLEPSMLSPITKVSDFYIRFRNGRSSFYCVAYVAFVFIALLTETTNKFCTGTYRDGKISHNVKSHKSKPKPKP